MGNDFDLALPAAQNEGFNRFTCFVCDFTLCLTCAHANMQHVPMPTGELPDASNAAAAALLLTVPPQQPPYEQPPPLMPPPLLPPPMLPMAQPPYPDGAAESQVNFKFTG